ncbi:HTH domain protein [Haloferax gibbonsii]|uniref:HTH domain protein n=1 Tax=Haloferax gibbonsii TaxID=35746 RepID=A0A871BDC6_HALGI|nr:HTH domain-containing protein [Haloferax gibbonsii]QOS10740.1 HTH domain protein [Haloferax gibbonsii]
MLSIEADTIGVLNRRSALLECLLQQPRDKRTLVDKLDVSRSTIDRGVRELESAGIVAYEGGMYGLTPVGEFLGQAFTDFQDTIETTTRLAPFLQLVDPDWFDIDLRSLQTARIWVAEANDSFGPLDSHIETVQAAHRYRGLLPSVGRESMEVKYRSILEHESEHEVIVDRTVAEVLQSEPVVDLFEDMIATGRVSVYVCDDPIPQYLGLFDQTVMQVGSCGNNGIPYALLETADDESFAWAARKYESYKDTATLLAGPS